MEGVGVHAVEAEGSFFGDVVFVTEGDCGIGDDFFERAFGPFVVSVDPDCGREVDFDAEDLGMVLTEVLSLGGVQLGEFLECFLVVTRFPEDGSEVIPQEEHDPFVRAESLLGPGCGFLEDF